MDYNFRSIEKKWQKKWAETGAFVAKNGSSLPKYYILSEFFGPSGNGIHLGHVKCYTPSDIVARYKRLTGFEVLYPAGWDAFGLPTENYAIKMKQPPAEVTARNVEIFKNQLFRLGYSFDWTREINTSSEEYYKWTQWIFLQLFKKGYAYKSEGLVNFCPSCQTVLSNEDSQGGICDRCKSTVIQEKRDVWYLRMRDYSEKMLDAVDEIDMKESHKEAQRNWIGKSVGCEIEFPLDGLEDSMKVFTTRPDTVFGVTFMAVSPEHPMIEKYKNNIKNYREVAAYLEQAAAKSSIERTADKDKTGVVLEGLFALNPFNGKRIKIFVSDYIMMGYGSGAIMAVPAHDTRDYDFAKKFALEIVPVISGGDIENEAYTGRGTMINSDFLNGMDSEDAKNKMPGIVEERGLGFKTINYKMQDWPFNRQRYWGEPFPVVNCEKCGCVPMDEKDLPLTLPVLEDLTPAADGSGPLSKATDWVNTVCPECGGPAKRETDTMPNWAGSSWYWLRFIDPKNNNEFVSQELLREWGGVDMYTGGTEHVTRHMLYASFWHNFLYDIGAVPHKLPFKRRMCNGLILDGEGKKMGKSSGNAVDPIEVIDKYGADAFRLHIMFMGEYEQNTRWTFDGITGCTRFLHNLWKAQELLREDAGISEQHAFALNTLIKRFREDIVDDTAPGEHQDFKFNTCIAKAMEFLNFIYSDKYITQEEYKKLLIILNPFIPHITSEIYEIIFGGDILDEHFPEYDESKLSRQVIELPVQVNGRVRCVLNVDKDISQDELVEMAKGELSIEGPIKKVIFVKGRILNLIV